MYVYLVLTPDDKFLGVVYNASDLGNCLWDYYCTHVAREESPPVFRDSTNMLRLMQKHYGIRIFREEVGIGGRGELVLNWSEIPNAEEDARYVYLVRNYSGSVVAVVSNISDFVTLVLKLYREDPELDVNDLALVDLCVSQFGLTIVRHQVNGLGTHRNIHDWRLLPKEV